MTAKALRDKIRRGINRLEQQAHKVKNADSSSITEVVGAEARIELCQELSMLIDTIAIEETPNFLDEPQEIYESPIEERFAEVLRAAQQAVGKRLGNGREKENVLIRMFVAYRLRSEGYTCEAIAKLMNRNHSAVVHYVRRRIPDMQSVPKHYKSELEMLEKMNEILDKD